MQNVRKNKRCICIPGFLKSLWTVIFCPWISAAVTTLCEGYPALKICSLSQQEVPDLAELLTWVIQQNFVQTSDTLFFCLLWMLTIQGQSGRRLHSKGTFISSQSALALLAVHKVSLWLALEALSKSKAMKYNLKVWPNSTEFSEEEKKAAFILNGYRKELSF